MVSVYDGIIIGLAVFVAAGTGYAILIAVAIGEWPEGTPGTVREGCLLSRGLEWCSQANALAWAVSGCLEAVDVEYDECVAFVFDDRGGEAARLPPELLPAMSDRGAEFWVLAGEAPVATEPRDRPVIG